jgi:hypothetical protein
VFGEYRHAIWTLLREEVTPVGQTLTQPLGLPA